MITWFQKDNLVYVVDSQHDFSEEEISRLTWLFSGAQRLACTGPEGVYIGPRKEMITPWSTNAVDIATQMGVPGITRMEMLQRVEAATEKEAEDVLEELAGGKLQKEKKEFSPNTVTKLLRNAQERNKCRSKAELVSKYVQEHPQVQRIESQNAAIESHD